MHHIAIPAFLLLLIFSSCDKYKNYKRATVVNTHNVSDSGCGYIFHFVDGPEQKPQYLPSAYQHNDLKVKVKLRELGQSVHCDADTTEKWLPLVMVDDIVRDLD